MIDLKQISVSIAETRLQESNGEIVGFSTQV